VADAAVMPSFFVIPSSMWFIIGEAKKIFISLIFMEHDRTDYPLVPAAHDIHVIPADNHNPFKVIESSLYLPDFTFSG